MVIMKKKLACWRWDRGISIDFDQQLTNRIMTYNGLEGCILNANNSYEDKSSPSRGDGCAADSLDEDDSSCSSSNHAFSSFSSRWTATKSDEQGLDEWDYTNSPQHFLVREKSHYKLQFSDIETMKEKFSKLLLGEDVTGGCKGLPTALALSNAITNVAVTVFGELWKLEPLSEDRRIKWRREMDWFLSPTKYMVELVPAKQQSSNGQTLEVMIPKARADIRMNLPALQKLDSMLIDALDSMINTGFWYEEGGRRAEGSKNLRQSKRWWLPMPRVPPAGLSETERKKLLNLSKFIDQIFKAAKAINESVLLEMPIPIIIKEALPKSGRANLGDDLYRILNTESSSTVEMINFLNVKSEQSALDIVNRLEAAVLAWKERILEYPSGKSPVRTSWSFMKDPISELDKIEFLINRAESLSQQLKSRYPNLPQTFLDVMKIQYGKDVGHAILEAYSRVLGDLAFNILSRIGDVLQEDKSGNPALPVAKSCFPGGNPSGISGISVPSLHVSHYLIDQMNCIDGNTCASGADKSSDTELSCDETKTPSVSITGTSSRSRVWCIGKESCIRSPTSSP